MNPFSLSTVPLHQAHTPPETYDSIRVRAVRPHQLDQQFEQKWKQLSNRSAEENPFLSPHYVLPAVKAGADKNPLLIAIERGEQLIGLGIFEERTASRRMPLPHLRSWQSQHGFLDGMLIDKTHGELALTAFWEYLQHGPTGWNAVEFPKLAVDQSVTHLLAQSATQSGVEYWTGKPVQRAVIHISGDVQQRMLSKMSTKRVQSLRRGWNYLQKQGDIQFSIKTSLADVAQCTDELLRLEALGWKFDAGTALASLPEQEQFFREMVQRFSVDQQVFFTQLAVANQVIATVVHLSIGTTAYAFKLGWDPKFERGCPGFQIKSLLVKCLDQLPDIRLIDSCACSGSFIEHIWPDSRSITPHLFMTTRAGVLAGSLVGGLRWVRDRAGQMLEIAGA